MSDFASGGIVGESGPVLVVLGPGAWVIPRSQLGPWCWPDPNPFPRLRLFRWRK